MEIISTEQAAERLKLRSSFSKRLLRLFFHFLKIDEFNQVYDRYKHLSTAEFVKAVQDHINYRIDFEEEELKHIPHDSPFIIVSNHPHGIVDGLVVYQVFSRVRGDIKIVVNDLLDRIVPLQSIFVPVTLFSDKNSALANGRKIFGEIAKGNPLLFFPAGSVAHFSLRRFNTADKTWDLTSLKFIEKSKLPLVPVYIRGRASFMYHFLYNLHPRLSLLWLVRELFNKKGRILSLSIGKSIDPLDGDARQTGRILREKVYALKRK